MPGLAPLKGVVLAGGRSHRLGQDKAALEFRGQTLLARAVDLLDARCGAVRVAVARNQTDDPLRQRFNCLIDLIPDAGPMAGLLAAQAADPDAAWWLLAVDMPRLTGATLDRLMASRSGRHHACALGCGGRPQPLCAIFEPQSRVPLREEFVSGRRSLRRWMEKTGIPLVEAAPGETASINSPEDLVLLST